MNPIPLFPENNHNATPKVLWLKITVLALHCALALFAVSKSLRRVSFLERAAVRTLRFASCALGHAPAETHLEFRADLPVQI